MSFDTEVAADSPLYWTKLDNTSGNPSSNGSSSLSTFIKGTSCTINQTGYAGIRAGDKAYALGTNNQSYLQAIGSTALSNSNQFSYETVVYWNGSTGTARTLFSNLGASASGNETTIGVTSTGKVMWRAATGQRNTTTNMPSAAWTHFIITCDGTTSIIYMNGTQIDSTSRTVTGASGTNLWAGRDDTAGCDGLVSEMMTYNGALTSTRVAAHYAATVTTANVSFNAGALTGTTATFPTPTFTGGTGNTYSAQVMTGTTGTFPTPTFAGQKNLTFTAAVLTGSGEMEMPYRPNIAPGPLTGSGSMPGAYPYEHQTVTTAAIRTRAALVDSAAPTTHTTWPFTTMNYKDPTSAQQTYVQPDFSSVPSGAIITGAKLNVKFNSGSTFATAFQDLEMVSIDQPFNYTTVTYNTRPTSGARTFAFRWNAPETLQEVRTFDISQLVIDMLAGNSYGFIPQYSTGNGGQSNAFEIGSNATISIEYVLPPTNGGFTAPTLTGSGEMEGVTVTVGVSESSFADPMMGSGSFAAATVIADRNIIVPIDVMDGSGLLVDAKTNNRNINATVLIGSSLMPAPGLATGSGSIITSDPMEGDGSAPNATFSDATNINIHAGVMAGSGLFKTNVEASDPRLHPYYQAVNTQVDYDDLWVAFLNKQAEYPNVTDEISRRYNELRFAPKAFGGVTFDQVGPADRLSFNFDGTGYIQTGIPNDGTPTKTYSYEFVFRTSKANQALMSGTEDQAVGTSTSFYGTSIEMRNGKIVVRSLGLSAFSSRWFDGGETLGRYDDGQWHHVVITNYFEQTDSGYNYDAGSLSFYVDGKLDRRISQTQGNAGSRMARIDYIGKPALSAVESSSNGSQEWFVGDMSMVVARRGYGLEKYNIEQNYYKAMGINAIYAGIMNGSSEMVNAKAKGNTTRVLYLTHINYSGFGEGVVRRQSYDAVNKRLVTVMRTYTGPNNTGGFRDAVTSHLRLIDLRTDIDVEDFDIIYVQDSSLAWNLAAALGVNKFEASERVNDFYDGIRWAVAEKGLGLYIDDAQIAKEIGFIDEFEQRELYLEKKSGAEFAKFRPGYGQLGSNYVDQYDWWAYNNMPAQWKIGNEYQWSDTHTLSGERIVATEQGLTSDPGYTLAEWTYYWYPDPFTRGGNEYFSRWDANDHGLPIGREMLFQTRLNSPSRLNGGETQSQSNFVYSVPDEFVNIGTVIAREIGNDWIEHDRPENVDANNATTIIIKEGTEINGVASVGRVFMAFNSSWGAPATIPMGLVLSTETAEQQQWQFSSRRSGGSYLVINIPTNTVIGTAPATVPNDPQLPEQGTGSTTKPGTTWSLFQPAEHPTTTVQSGDMGFRGFAWLQENAVGPIDGEVNFQAQVMTGTGAMGSATAGAQKSNTYVAQPMIGNGQFIYDSDDVNINAFPMIGYGQVQSTQRIIKATPMVGSGQLIGNFEDVFASGRNVSLTWTRTSNKEIVLYLRRQL
jgi:concanavalin A-like lectin/glucanase superfamily protein